MNRNVATSVKSVYVRNWPTLIGLFCVLYIWASLASARAHSYEIVTDPGVYGYFGVLVGMIASAAMLLYLLLAKKRQQWLKCESILPPLCATLLVTSRFFFDWEDALSSFAANTILGFSSFSMVILAFEGVRNEIAGRRSQRVIPLFVFLVYVAYFACVFLAWPHIGDEMGDRIGNTLLIVFLFSVIVNMFSRMQKFDADEAPENASSAAESMVGNIPAFSQEFGLSPREQEVLVLLAQGFSAPFIADKLFISNGTVKTHTKRIYQKLGVSKRDELIDLLRTKL